MAAHLSRRNVRADSCGQNYFRNRDRNGLGPSHRLQRGDLFSKMAIDHGHVDQHNHRYWRFDRLHFWLCVEGKYIQIYIHIFLERTFFSLIS